MASQKRQTTALPAQRINLEAAFPGEVPGVHYDSVVLWCPSLGIEQRFNIGKMARRHGQQGQGQGQLNAALQATYAPETEVTSMLKAMSQEIKGLKNQQSALANNIKKMGGTVSVSTGRGQQKQQRGQQTTRSNAASSYSTNAAAIFDKVPA